MKCTLVLLSENNGKQTFSKDCLIDFVRKNKVLKTQIGKITNIRYDPELFKVYGDIELVFRAAVNGDILSRIETPKGQLITEFRPKDVKIFIGTK